MLDQEARSAVLEQLSEAAQRFNDEERMAAVAADLVTVKGARQYERWLFRAYIAEFHDKMRPAPVFAACGACELDKCDGCHMCRAKTMLSWTVLQP